METMHSDIRQTIYLDNAATTWPKPSVVYEEMLRFQRDDAGSPNRAGHRKAAAAERVVNKTREQLASLLGAADPRQIILCFNCTDALNMGIKGVLREGDHVITTAVDHNSVQRPLQAMVDRRFISLTRVPVGSSGMIDPDDIVAAVTPQTRLIATLHASNVTGMIQPVEQIGRIAREKDVLFLLDAAQSVGLLDVNVEAMNIDLLAFPGHKALLGPAGTGALYVGPQVEMQPWREGGTGGDSAFPTQPENMPTFLESGTHNTVGLAGLSAALSTLDVSKARSHEKTLLGRVFRQLDDPAFHIYMPQDFAHRVGVVSFQVKGKEPSEVARILDEANNIAVRPGLHCAPYMHQAMGSFPQGALRLSLGWANTIEQIDCLGEVLRKIAMCP